ncbi:hypothetical protein QVD17_33641 [Tagetes erecta]|uniref:Disease resistance R13L4/SHOC-2-like LRR domain-containing protein n=1 Tax=Tagetes erecta TaxID=13708 RepID=A0AAD8NE16_TARER|nr:hypothetical protein QVD17_33641 [Tagetes erecta]
MNWFNFSSLHPHNVHKQTLPYQKAFLGMPCQFYNELTLKHVLKHVTLRLTLIASWNQSVDCYKWGGISCHTDGHVTRLDLNDYLSGAINDSSTLFRLHFLRSLNLAYNAFDVSLLSSGFGNLTQLTYLNLSNANFQAHEVSLVTTKLVTLDLSSAITYTLDLGILIQNLTGLKDNLQVLSLKNCNLSGPLDPSLAKLKHLSVVLLDGNTFSSEIPDSFTDLKNLTVLSLQGCNLSGTIPYKIFQVPTLKSIDFSSNVMLKGPLPEMSGALELQNLVLSNTRVKLNQNSLTGRIPSSHLERLDKLDYLDLARNIFTGTLPESFLTLKSLQSLYLCNNSFSGKLNESMVNVSTYQLNTLDLSSNKFEGSIPGFIFKLTAISTLTLSANKFTGRVDLHMFGNLKELYGLDLSYNNLTVSVQENKSSAVIASLSKLNMLKLVSCKMQQIPDLKNQSSLMTLDLSDNQLSGEIPNWIWEVGNGFLRSLNLSHNVLSGLQQPYAFPLLLDVLDLPSNHLEGDIPIPPKRCSILRGNNLTENVSDVFPESCHLQTLDLSGNRLQGPLPRSLVSCKNLMANRFHGNITCLGSNGNNLLQIIDIASNGFSGVLSPTLFTSFQQIIDTFNDTQSHPHFKHPANSAIYYQESMFLVLKGTGREVEKILSIFTSIDFSDNSFQGSIPVTLGDLKLLT